MRRWSPLSPSSLMALLLTVPLLAGCLGGKEIDDDANQIAALATQAIIVPEGATLIEETADGITKATLSWVDVDLPFEEVITLPEGATIVRTTASLAEDVRVSTYMKHNETGRRRCNPDIADTAWNILVTGTHTCSGVTAIDRPGDNWTVTASGALATATSINVTFENTPADGLLGRLDLSQLSQRDFVLEETTYGYVPSFDGTNLWTEVTLPKGEGPWPTIIAASPYNGFMNRLGQHADAKPAMWEYFTQDWAERGYAVVNTDVRGFGLSEGCVEVWSENEQQDQKFTVDWVRQQPWSNGRVGFYGQSYVATTPLAAASLDAEGLDAVIMVAPVVNAYEDWHFGGVPNGESTGSPAAYQALVDTPPLPYTNPNDPLGIATRLPGYVTSLDPQAIAMYSVLGLCDATMTQEANDPRHVYNAFYLERDFKTMVKNIEAAVLFTEGFEDANVKVQMVPDWFNEIDSPKLGLFGHWVHQHPTRADEEAIFLGWMDQYVKDKPLGFETLPNVEITNNLEQTRQSDVWPEPDLPIRTLTVDFAGGTIVDDAAAESGNEVSLILSASRETGAADMALNGAGRHLFEAGLEATNATAFSGIVTLVLDGRLEGGGNGYLSAQLFDIDPDGRAGLVTYGMLNLAHNRDHTGHTPRTVMLQADDRIDFLPTDYVLQSGHELVVRITGAVPGDDYLGFPGGGPNVYAITNAHLELPEVSVDAYTDAAATAQR